MQKTKIDWGFPNLYTWNPITGCKRACPYCYARRIHERFNPGVPFSQIVFHAERLLDSMPKKPSYIFVGSMSDIEYWSGAATTMILEICTLNPQHTFLFLSKNPASYEGFMWPTNCILGLTITQIGIHEAFRITDMMDYPRRFLSIEPLLGPITGNLENTDFKKIIIGAMSGPGNIIPKKEWIQSVKDNCPADRLYWKLSMRPYL